MDYLAILFSTNRRTNNGGRKWIIIKKTHKLKTKAKLLKKQEKLLDLYKELHNKYRYPTWQNDEYVKEIKKQIKELENE